MHEFVWLSACAVHLKLPQCCLGIDYTPRQNKMFKQTNKKPAMRSSSPATKENLCAATQTQCSQKQIKTKKESSKCSWEGDLRVWKHPVGIPQEGRRQTPKVRGGRREGRASGTWGAGSGRASGVDQLRRKPPPCPVSASACLVLTDSWHKE